MTVRLSSFVSDAVLLAGRKPALASKEGVSMHARTIRNARSLAITSACIDLGGHMDLKNESSQISFTCRLILASGRACGRKRQSSCYPACKWARSSCSRSLYHVVLRPFTLANVGLIKRSGRQRSRH